MANKTPKTGDFYMFMDKDTPVEDNSLESAVRMCIPSGTRPTRIQNFTSIVTQIPDLDLIDSTYGTKGSTPSNMGQLRGFPKPSVTANFTEYFNTATGTDGLRVECTMSTPVGFDVNIHFQNLSEDSTVYEVAINKGQTSSGVYPLFAADATDTSISYSMTFYSSSSTEQYTPSLTGSVTGSLLYVEPILNDNNYSIDHNTDANIGVLSSDDCDATLSQPSGYTSDSIWCDGTIAVNSTLYKGDKASNGGTTIVPDRYFRIQWLTGYRKIVTNTSGVVTSIEDCGGGGI
jgi:hypothetical protein